MLFLPNVTGPQDPTVVCLSAWCTELSTFIYICIWLVRKLGWNWSENRSNPAVIEANKNFQHSKNDDPAFWPSSVNPSPVACCKLWDISLVKDLYCVPFILHTWLGDILPCLEQPSLQSRKERYFGEEKERPLYTSSVVFQLDRQSPL